jgi:hypothetical protein
LLTAENTGRSVVLDLDSDKASLRVRAREEQSDEENDGLKSNHSALRLKVYDIARLEVGRNKSSKKSSSISPSPVKSFSIVMRKVVSDTHTFNFEAESPNERDAIIASIKGLLEHSKIVYESHRRKTQSPMVDNVHRKERSSKRTTPSKRDASIASQNHLKSEIVQTPKTPGGEEGLETRAVYFDFDLSEGTGGAIETEILSSSKTPPGSEERDDYGDRSSDDSQERISDDSREVCEADSSSAEAREKKDASEASVGRELSIVGLKNVAVEVAGNDWSLDDILCGMNTGSSERRKQRRLKSRVEPGDLDLATTKKEERAIQRMDEKYIYEPLGCNPLGCQSQALAAVEDVELAAMAANQVSAGPWCTDDVCTASLKDFATTMKGIFEMKQKPKEGQQPNNEKRRAIAEEFITGVLGAPPTMASLLSVKDIWNTAAEERPVKKRKKRLENRSRSIGAQAARLNRLRNRMTFKAAEFTEKMPFVQVISSFDDMERSGRFSRKPHSSELPGGPKPGDSSNFLNNVVDNMLTEETPDSDEDILYYDSDPEDAREYALKRGPRRAIADRENKTLESTPRQEALCGIPMTRLNLNRRWKRMDDDAMSDIIEVSQLTILFCIRAAQ